MRNNQYQVKVRNKTLVLSTIRKNAPLSRAAISEKLGLTKATISSLVKELLNERLCYESGPGISSGGRRPILLNFNDKAGYSIGIDLGVNYINGVLADFSGNIILKRSTNFQISDYKKVLGLMIDLISALLKDAPKSHYGIVGIGIGVPGIVDITGDHIKFAPNLKWTNKEIKKDLENQFNIPIIVENEANVGAYGEKIFGFAQDFDNIIYISAGIGLGVGLLLDGQIFKGAQGFSGEMGHTIINMNGEICDCGSQGCWEIYASEKYILSQVKKLNLTIPLDQMNIDALLNLANENEEILKIFNDVGNYLGIGINNIINTFDPQQIIIGNSLAKAKEFLQTPLLEVINKNTLKHNKGNLKVDFSNELSNFSILGASTLATELFLSNEKKQFIMD